MCLVTDKKGETAYSDICTVKLNSSSIKPLTAQLSVYSIDAPPAGVVSITCLPSGGTGPYRFNWEFSLNGITFLSTGFETQTIMIPGSSSVSVIYYRCRVKDANNEEAVTKQCKVNFAG